MRIFILLFAAMAAIAQTPAEKPAAAPKPVALAKEAALELEGLQMHQEKVQRILQDAARAIDELTKVAMARELERMNALIAAACGSAQIPVAECSVDLKNRVVKRVEKKP